MRVTPSCRATWRRSSQCENLSLGLRPLHERVQPAPARRSRTNAGALRAEEAPHPKRARAPCRAPGRPLRGVARSRFGFEVRAHVEPEVAHRGDRLRWRVLPRGREPCRLDSEAAPRRQRSSAHHRFGHHGPAEVAGAEEEDRRARVDCESVGRIDGGGIRCCAIRAFVPRRLARSANFNSATMSAFRRDGALPRGYAGWRVEGETWEGYRLESSG